VSATQEYLGEFFGPFGRSLNPETGIRLSSLGRQCHARREQRGLSIAEAARALRVPQYRLKAIETGRIGEIQGAALRAYIAHLGMGRWYKRWSKANPSLAAKWTAEADEQGAAPDERRPGKERGGTRR
jgi:transcriptional regulator with XRE-family HTH domain